jgi:hypothetical protein
MALQLPPRLAYAPNPDTVVVQVTQVQLSMSAPNRYTLYSDFV